MKETTKERQVLIEYPKRNESIASPEYTFRIRAKAEKSIEVSIDGGPWRSCRSSVGYWWFDWRRGKPGKHKVIARALSENHEELARHSQPFGVDWAAGLPAQEPRS